MAIEDYIEEGPNIGASSNEPGIREIIEAYYLPYFSQIEAEELAEKYLKATEN